MKASASHAVTRSAIASAEDTRCMFDLEPVKLPPRRKRLLDDDESEGWGFDDNPQSSGEKQGKEEEHSEEQPAEDGVEAGNSSQHSLIGSVESIGAGESDAIQGIRGAVLQEMEHLNSKGFSFVTPDMRQLLATMSPRRLREFDERVELRTEAAMAEVEAAVKRTRDALKRRQVFDAAVNEERLASTLHIELQRKLRPRDIRNSVLREMVEEQRFRAALGKDKFEALEDRLSDMFRGAAATANTPTAGAAQEKDRRSGRKSQLLAPKFLAPMVRRWRKRLRKRTAADAAAAEAAASEELRCRYAAAQQRRSHQQSLPALQRSSRRSSSDARFQDAKAAWQAQKAEAEAQRRAKAAHNRANMTVRSRPVFLRASSAVSAAEMAATRSWAVDKGILPTAGTSGPFSPAASVMAVTGAVTRRGDALKEAQRTVQPLFHEDSRGGSSNALTVSGSHDASAPRNAGAGTAATGHGSLAATAPPQRVLQSRGLLSLSDLARCTAGAQAAAADRLALLKGKYVPQRIQSYEELLLAEPAALSHNLSGNASVAERRNRLMTLPEHTKQRRKKSQFGHELDRKEAQRLRNTVQLAEATRTRALGAKRDVSLRETHNIVPIAIEFNVSGPRNVDTEPSKNGAPAEALKSPIGDSLLDTGGQRRNAEASSKQHDVDIRQSSAATSRTSAMPSARAPLNDSCVAFSLEELKRVWERLEMPSQQRFEFLIKYSQPKYAHMLPSAVDVWMDCTALVLYCEHLRTTLRKALPSNGSDAPSSDPVPFTLSSDERRRLVKLGINLPVPESQYRDALSQVKHQLEKAADELFVNFDDVLTYRGLDYIASIANNSLAAVPQALNPALRRYGGVLNP